MIAQLYTLICASESVSLMAIGWGTDVYMTRNALPGSGSRLGRGVSCHVDAGHPAAAGGMTGKARFNPGALTGPESIVMFCVAMLLVDKLRCWSGDDGRISVPF